MTCCEMVEFLMAYLDGELPEAQRYEFAAHLRDCPPCEVYLDTYCEAVRLGKSVCAADSDDLPSDVPEGFVQAILSAREA